MWSLREQDKDHKNEVVCVDSIKQLSSSFPVWLWQWGSWTLPAGYLEELVVCQCHIINCARNVVTCLRNVKQYFLWKLMEKGSKLVYVKTTGHNKLRKTVTFWVLADRRKLTPFVILKTNHVKETLVLELFVNVTREVGRTGDQELIYRREECWLLILSLAT